MAELSYAQRVGGLSSTITVSVISLETTLELNSHQMSDYVKERIQEAINLLTDGQHKYDNQ